MGRVRDPLRATQKTEGKDIIVVDCSHVCYSSFFTMGHLMYEAHGTGIILGFLSQIFAACNRFKTHRVVLCWDSQKSNRKRLYPGYKEKRQSSRDQEMEEDPEKEAAFKDLFRQIHELRTFVIPTLGFKNNFRQTGYEADDLIAGIVLDYPDKCVVISTDNDLYQLLDFCDLYFVSKKKVYTKEDFQLEYGILPMMWVDVKMLAGCPGDEVEGIKGVGIGRAVSYLKGELPDGVIKQRIESEEGQAIRERNDPLVRLPFGPKASRVLDFEEKFEKSNFVAVFEKYGFASLLSDKSMERLNKVFRFGKS